MLPKKAISTFISALNSRIPPPVHTAGIEGSRPVPAVLIENMTIDEQNFHNSNHAADEYDSNGNVISQTYRHHYDIRIELLVRDDDEVDAYDILGQVQRALSEISRNPRTAVHEDVREVKSLGSGGISYQFYEPTESEIKQSVVLKTFFDSTDSSPDVIENIGNSYTFS